MTATKEQPTIDNRSIRKQRHIIRRIVIRGTLILDTPTCLASGDADSPTDLPLLRDSISDHALLTGSSIAGALRNYLQEREHGYLTDEKSDNLATVLFGGTRKDDDGEQSNLIIDDVISTQPIQSELRDGVKIDSITRTAEDKKKYDLELLQAGTEFSLCFELLIEKDSNETELRKGLAIALSGLQNHEISLGMKKRRGFGRCHVKEWQVWNFDLTDAGDRTAWLLFDRECTNKQPVITNKITDALGVVLDEKEDQRDRFTINATFTLASPLLIRSGQAETGRAPDVVHLKSYRIINQQIKWLFDRAIQILGELPSEIDLWSSENWELFFFAHNLLKAKVLTSVLSGTSLAGVLRHRAERIAKTLQCSFGQNPKCDKEPEIIKSIFGHVENKRSQASRLIVHESTINHTTDLVQTRIAIDRFTGGAYHGALFQEQPIFANHKTELKLEIELRNPIEHEIGLLLLLLKDLWTEDLPVGGSSSIGRGRLKGKQATIKWKDSTWEIKQNRDNSLEITPESDKEKLRNYVSELVKYIKDNNNNEPSNS
ncbi:conserved hypothetical protein [Planktothrix serta PCC 8927]|uniref:CRISPR type III-associated protein domain-containing protein n=1 Tax=Planktothrix serta PCC 8927 TaxID=671068 RepID=A0A7Z9BZS0_9CYAN|nr:RAMP superfamily CRISPR-associated protein [Planktothrix serta]VXD25828.1 conserved hypothetical protein [Planktothrix serta PCC 8927]